MVSIKRL